MCRFCIWHACNAVFLVCLPKDLLAVGIVILIFVLILILIVFLITSSSKRGIQGRPPFLGVDKFG